MSARVALLAGLLLAAGCATPTLQQREDAINAALASAYVACSVALQDKSMTWEPGAREYCETIVAGGCKAVAP